MHITTVSYIAPDYFCYFAGSISRLQYFTLTSPTYLPRLDDGSSDAIDVPGGFPFGSQNFSSVFVRCGDYNYNSSIKIS